MVGIVSYGAHIPRFRLNRKAISSALQWMGPPSMPGEKAVANFDEDSLSMAVNAAFQCMKGVELADVDSVFFATTTSPYREREGAAIISEALALADSVRTSDITDSLKAGTGALSLACDSVKAGSVKQALVSAADCRLGKPLSRQETAFGDAAAALLIGSKNPIATLEGSYSVSFDFPDYFRTQNDIFVRNLEERLIRDECYTRFIPQSVAGLLKKCGLESKDIARVVFPAINARDHAAVGKMMGFKPEQVQELLLATVGDSGAASPLLMLVAALEDAKPGDNIIVASHGNGSDALLFKVTDEINNKKDANQGVKKQLSNKIDLGNYNKYLAFRKILPIDEGPRGEPGPTALPLTWRERKTIYSLIGSKCRKCGTIQYPPQKICVQCSSVYEMDDYRLSNQDCVLFSFTEDVLAADLNPPVKYGILDFKEGGRYVFDITDCPKGSLAIGMNMEMTFRKKYADENKGFYQYFWKARPVEISQGGSDA